MKRPRILTALLVLGTAVPAPAADLYLGAGISSPMEGRIGRDSQQPDGQIGFDARAGVEVGRFLGVEAAWHDLGDVTWCEGCADAGGTARTHVWSAGLTLGWTFGRVRPFLKGGWFQADTEGSEQTIAGPRPVTRDESGAFGEAGLRALLGGHLGLRLAYERFSFESQNDGAVTLGAEYRF